MLEPRTYSGARITAIYRILSGIQGVNREEVIDLDECGVFIESGDGGIGKAYLYVSPRRAPLWALDSFERE